MHPKLSAGLARWGRAKVGLANLGARTQTLFRRVLIGRKPSLVNRLSAFLLMGAIVIYMIGLVGLYFVSSRLVEDTLRQQARQWIAEMDELGAPLYFARKADLVAIEKRIKNFAEISYVRYYDSSGKRLLGQLGRYQEQPPRPLTEAQLGKLAEVARTDTPYAFDKADGDTEYLHVLAPVRVRSIRSDGLLNFDFDKSAEDIKIIGYIDLAIDPRPYRKQLLRSFGYGSLFTAVILLLAVIVGGRLLRKALHPLTELQTPLERLAKGEIDVTVKTGGDREITAIADALNVTIGALKERNQELLRLAEHDGLTGLFNRNYFSRALDAELARAKSTGKSSALIFIDLDRFKHVNDTLGHAAGDRLLLEVANLIKSRMRAGDIIARFGGDEFSVIVHDVAAPAAVNVAKSIHDVLLDCHFMEQGQSFTISCTIGIALITRESRDAKEVLLQADSACYRAKAGGRNRFFLYEPDRQRQLETATDVGWSQLIKSAIQADAFTLVYQPIVSLAQHKQDFYEVFVRMPDQNGKVLLPELFLPVAERFGLLAQIDRWVITHALKALARARQQRRDLVFSLNLSGQALADPAVLECIKDSLAANALPPSSVIFEITEQTAVRYMDRTPHIAQNLINHGCRFAVDDFGVGYSSFSYLKRLPVSLVKIDGSFIENLGSEPVDQLMVKAIAQAAKTLGKEVVAEFVQNDATVALLKSYGVDFVQGYHLGRPTEVFPRQALTIAASGDKKPSRRSGAGTV